MLDLNDLRLFVQIVDHRGILRAGRALGLPKSTMSRRLAALEEALKARLVTRSSEDFRLTPAGEKTYRAARAMVDAARRAEEALLRPRSHIAGHVSLSVAPLIQRRIWRNPILLLRAADARLARAISRNRHAACLASPCAPERPARAQMNSKLPGARLT